MGKKINTFSIIIKSLFTQGMQPIKMTREVKYQGVFYEKSIYIIPIWPKLAKLA